MQRWLGGSLALWVAIGSGAIAQTQPQTPATLSAPEDDRWLQEGRDHFEARRLQEAQQAWEAALNHYRTVGNRKGEASSLNNLGLVQELLGNYSQAIAFYEQALTLKRSLGDRAGEASTLGNLGLVYDSLGQIFQAIEAYEQQLAIARDIGDQRVEAMALNNLGLAYHLLGVDDRAIAVYEQALVIKRSLGDRGGEGSTLGNLGIVYFDNGDFDRAIALHQQHEAIAREVGDRSSLNIALNNLGLVYFRSDRLPEAEQAFRESLAVAEGIERELGDRDRDRIAFFETQRNIYRLLQSVLVARGQPLAALEVADRGRARSLADFLHGGQGSEARSPLTAAQMQQLARDRQATIIEYAISRSQLLIWVVPPQGEIQFRKVNPRSLNVSLLPAIAQARAAATNAINTHWTPTAQADQPLPAGQQELHQAYRVLIEPIESLLPADGSQVIVIPHQELALVPFAALLDRDRRFLVDRFALSVAPSIQVLAVAQARRDQLPQSGPMVAIGNPQPLPSDLGELPYAEQEARTIASLFDVEPIVGDRATEAALKRQWQGAGYLHLATHGMVAKSDRSGLDTWLALAPDPLGGEDGRLTLAEIFDSQLTAQLAVLSACDTGNGAISGEGTIGLARAFLKAGVPTVVASLWKVPDRPTALLMEEFYRHLLAGRDRATALQRAMQTVRTRYPHPFNWAAFVVIGDSR